MMTTLTKDGRYFYFESLLFPDGAARQGLPTSPSLANIAATPIDNEIAGLKKPGRFQSFVYTRYADDLTFSCNTLDMIHYLQRVVPLIVRRHGFEVNASKTRIQSARSGMRMITGVAVGRSGIAAPRELKRKIRAGEHQVKHGLRRRFTLKLLDERRKGRLTGTFRLRLRRSLSGLKEWARLVRPKGCRPAVVKPTAGQSVQIATANVIAAIKSCGRFFRRLN